MIRKLSNLSKTKSQNIKKDDIITDRYYIYMYFPLHSNVGVVFYRVNQMLISEQQSRNFAGDLQNGYK